MIAPCDLRAGDCLLYAPRGFFGWVIATKTWHKIAHVEVYDGLCSWASRDGLGVGLYPFRNTELAFVLRPKYPFAMDQARAWARTAQGTKYGWLELANFVGLTCGNGGLFCSQFVTLFYRYGGLWLFPMDEPARIAPFQFLDYVGDEFDVVYSPKGTNYVGNGRQTAAERRGLVPPQS